MTKHSDDVKNGEICKVRQIPVSCRAQILKFSLSPEGRRRREESYHGMGGGEGTKGALTLLRSISYV